MSDSKSQIGPRIDTDIADDYRSFIKDRSNGTYKGKLGEAVEKALKLHMSLYYLQRAKDLDCLEEQKYVENEGAEQRIRGYIEESADGVLDASEFMIHPKYEIVSREGRGGKSPLPVRDLQWEDVRETVPGFVSTTRYDEEKENETTDDPDIAELEEKVDELTEQLERLAGKN